MNLFLILFSFLLAFSLTNSTGLIYKREASETENMRGELILNTFNIFKWPHFTHSVTDVYNKSTCDLYSAETTSSSTGPCLWIRSLRSRGKRLMRLKIYESVVIPLQPFCWKTNLDTRACLSRFGPPHLQIHFIFKPVVSQQTLLRLRSLWATQGFINHQPL